MTTADPLAGGARVAAFNPGLGLFRGYAARGPVGRKKKLKKCPEMKWCWGEAWAGPGDLDVRLDMNWK